MSAHELHLIRTAHTEGDPDATARLLDTSPSADNARNEVLGVLSRDDFAALCPDEVRESAEARP